MNVLLHGRKRDKKINEFAGEGVKAKDGSVCEVILCFFKFKSMFK